MMDDPPRSAFVSRYGSVYEHSPWVAERAYDGGITAAEPPAEVFRRVVERAGREAQLALLRAHPDLAGKLGTELTDASKDEQAGAGLDRCTPEEFAEFTALNARYTERFGFPFIIAVKGLDRAAILERFRHRVDGDPEREFRTALDEVHKIARFRLDALAATPAPKPAERETVAPDDLAKLVTAALRRAGADDTNAAAISAQIMAAETAGSESHGVFRLPAICAGMARGAINGRAEPRFLSAPPAAVIVEGDKGVAAVVYQAALPRLEQRAKEQGAAVLSARNTVHAAAMWHEVEWLAERGLAGFACTANFPYIAPHGGTAPFFGTNPIAFAFPRENGTPVVFDFASSQMARGDIMLADRDGRRVPPGTGIGPDGAPTSDPARILAGAQLPFGGHKGSAIALMVECLAAALVGGPFSDEAGAAQDPADMPCGGIFILALSPDKLGGEGSVHRADAFFDRLAAIEGARLPGAARHARRSTGGQLSINAALLSGIRELAGA